MIMFEELGIKWRVVADSQFSLSAKVRYILVLKKMHRIKPTGSLPPAGDHFPSQAVYFYSLAVIWLLGIIVAVKLILDVKESSAVFPPGSNMQSRKAEN